jgi:hypothetical protein
MITNLIFLACHQTKDRTLSQIGPLVGPRQREVRPQVGGGHESSLQSSGSLSSSPFILGSV